MRQRSKPATAVPQPASDGGPEDSGGKPVFSPAGTTPWSPQRDASPLSTSSEVLSSADSSSACESSPRSSSSCSDSDDEQRRVGNRGGVTGAANAAAASADYSKSRSARAKRWLKKNLIPEFVHEYGRTVYGGNPLSQQTLPGVFNYPSPFILVPIFYVLMVPFLIVGGAVLVKGRQQHIIEQEYSHIHQYQYVPSNTSVNINQGILQFTADGVTHAQGTRTWLEINISRGILAPVYMYYKISNMHQNHRDFHRGRSNSQLRGKSTIDKTYTCQPYTYPGFRNNKGETPITITDATGRQVTRPARYFTYNPCGIAPWSKFNDTFVLYRKLTPAEVLQASISGVPVLHGGVDGTTPVELICNGTDFGLKGEPLDGSVAVNRCSKMGISWKADRNIRFHNMTLREDWWSLYYPYPTTNEYLRNGWYLDEPGHSLPDPSDYDLQVWMRASFTSNFRKLYRIIDMPLYPGTYLVDISEFYDVVSFRGRKSVVLQHTNWIGGPNIGLGVIFILMGCLSFILGVTFTVECLLQLNGVNRYERLDEPKRSWYVFPPNEPEFASYYQLRLRRHIPMAQLQSLRKAVAVLEDLVHASETAPLTQQQSNSDTEVSGAGGNGHLA
ncbi:conserved hypothetical protein [Leishmania braziliensis MHOM/BR/75/M2904]|uniref:LEM3/CDC50 family protein n=2 Tax=Leishmania braziliensis TaxID=5660 RepID=A4H5T1_LEIBR|nr:conserved hypothetical protein [Leishmania braziliensis MHOM/BR/75/M2904]KAI5690738.1 LEM3 [Leishmania braziliensis]CAJ2467548.1 unnamed protein product [Leishmania braziliensis]CAM41847.1 conserved hypothetical protein [Leishmania braziliensis MHOM/BR/75/M2904]SYZ63328.1 LEM3_(ligand-effect_modulator_3)_family_/_CDC50_family [Leishmania braziliensis MHOM/BR/75/M2904]